MRSALLFHRCVMRRSGWWGTSSVCMCSCGQSVQQFRDIEEEVQVYKTEAASTQQKIAELKEKNSCDGDVENKAGKTQVIELALSACAHVEFRAEARQLRDIHAWVARMRMVYQSLSWPL